LLLTIGENWPVELQRFVSMYEIIWAWEK